MWRTLQIREAVTQESTRAALRSNTENVSPGAIDIRLPASYSQAMPTLPSNVSSLTAAEKSELIDALWEDLESHGYTLSPEQAEELDRRIDSCEKNPPTGIPWEQVKAGLPQR